MEPCPSLIREGLTLEDMIMKTYKIVPILSNPIVSDKLSATLGKYSQDQTNFRFFIRKNNSYICDRIQLYEKRSGKHNFTHIECIKAYNQGKEIFSHGSAGNNWCSKTITLTENTLIESINVKSKLVIEKIEFRLKVNDDYKLIEIGRENDQESNSVDVLSENVFGFYGSFVRIDELNCLNTFGLIFSENKSLDLPISSTNKTVFNTPVIELNEKELKKTIKVPINAVGRIIGYGGFNAKKIKEETNAKVFVDDKLGTCTLIGTRKSIKKAEEIIDSIIKTNGKKETDFELPYRIPKKLIALVIGSSGSNLKIIRNQTNCKTQIEDKQNDIGKCIVTGPNENLPRAVKSIGKLVRTAQIIEISNILRKHEIENENDLTSECILDEGVDFVRKIQLISSRKREMLETDLKESEYIMRIKNFNSNPTSTFEEENWRNFKNI